MDYSQDKINKPRLEDVSKRRHEYDRRDDAQRCHHFSVDKSSIGGAMTIMYAMQSPADDADDYRGAT